MSTKAADIKTEIKQAKPFASFAEEAGVALARTADVLGDRVAAFLKPFGVSPTQYNVLRILRGAGTQGRMCSEIGERMITRDPDVTRLLDRMEKLGWIERARDTRDRRVVVTRISRSGLSLLKEIDKPLEEFTRRGLGQLSDRKLKTLIDLLDEVRQVSRAEQ